MPDVTIAQPSPETAISGPGGRAGTRTFAGSAESVSKARAWVKSFVPGSPAADDVALLTTELVTNSIKYSRSRCAGGQVAVKVRLGDGSIRVDVIDQGGIISYSHGLGYGLAIVRELADECGCEGPCHWFSLRTGGAS